MIYDGRTKIEAVYRDKVAALRPFGGLGGGGGGGQCLGP